MSDFNPIICVDFDGVIHSYTSGWKGVDVIPDPPVPGAIEWLERHLPVPDHICAMAPPHEGPIVQIYSSRSKSWRGRRAMKRWLIKHGLHHAYISDGLLKFPKKKPAAFLTIDDRAICFDGTFPETEEMLAFKPWFRGLSDGCFSSGKKYDTQNGFKADIRYIANEYLCGHVASAEGFSTMHWSLDGFVMGADPGFDLVHPDSAALQEGEKG